MNRWTSKKPLWPVLATLGCLFVLALVAPSSWHRYRSQLHSLSEELKAPETVTSTPIQPVATMKPRLNETELFVSAPWELVELPVVAAEPRFTSAELALNPPRLKVPCPLHSRLPKSLISTSCCRCDVLLAIVDRLPNQEPQANQEPQTEIAIPRHQVQVSNDSDRLAMLDTRTHRNPELLESNEPDLAPQTVAENDRLTDLLPDVSQRFPADEIEEPELVEQPTPHTLQPITQSTPREVVPQPLIRQRPQVLFNQLEALKTVPQASPWAEHVVTQLHRLTDETSTSTPEALALLQQLRHAADKGNSLAASVSQTALQQSWYQASQSLERRLGIWQALLDSQQQEAIATDFPPLQPSMMPVLTEVAARPASESNGSDWRDYLMLDPIAAATSEGAGIDSKGRSKLALEILERMSNSRLSEAQVQFLATSPLLELRQLLQHWAAQSIDLDRLAALVERYETNRELHYAAAIVQVQQQLQWSDDPSLLALADHLDRHYRGSNMRIALSEDLLNRLVPAQTSTVSSVR